MSRLPPRLRLLPLLLPLAACGTLERAPAPYWMPADGTHGTPAPASLEALMAYHGYVGRLNGDEWGKELARVRAARGEDAACARHAMLAAAPAAAAGERAQAGALFERCERELVRAKSPASALVTVLRSEYAERSRADERQREASRRADDLAQKLNELKAIERTLLDRAAPGRGK